jgi:RNA polymerase sigma factor (TIGR02999 family)
MSEATRLINAIDKGDPHAAGQLLPLVYDELRKLAVRRMAQEKSGQTLQATALVHEAYLRLTDNDESVHWHGRGHFFAAAAEAMRRILIDNARRKRRPKHGGDLKRITLDETAERDESPSYADDLLELDAALERLERGDPQSVQLVKLRYFTGLTIPQAAEVLGISPRQADLLWSFARAWLRRELNRQ